MKMYFAFLFAGLTVGGTQAVGQDASSPKPLASVIGTITAVDTAAHTILIKEDKTDAQDTIQLTNTRTLIKVAPGAKDLKNATRITANDLTVGDRVDIRGSKLEDTPNTIAARAVILMSARDLKSAHQAEAAAWQNSTGGVVHAINPVTGTLTITTRTAEGPKQVAIETSSQTQFIRYSPETPATPAESKLSDIQVGDQVRVLGDKSADGASIAASRLYSGAFRTVSGTILSIAPDGKSLTIRNLADKQPMQVALSDSSAIRKLPPMMAGFLARRLNPGQSVGSEGASPSTPRSEAYASRQQQAPADGGNAPPPGSGPGMHGRSNGDVSQMIEKLPKESVSDLKAGDAVVIAGVISGADNHRILATSVIAGVEPILQSAPARQRGEGSLGGDWGLSEMTVPQ
jgi:hypothetical protein